METKFSVYEKNNYTYDFNHIIKNIPDYIIIENEPELWYNAALKATNNNKNMSSYTTVISIFNNMLNKKINNINIQQITDSKYDYYKKHFDQISWYGRENDKKFYNDLLNKLKETGKLSQLQWDFLRRISGKK